MLLSSLDRITLTAYRLTPEGHLSALMSSEVTDFSKIQLPAYLPSKFSCQDYITLALDCLNWLPVQRHNLNVVVFDFSDLLWLGFCSNIN